MRAGSSIPCPVEAHRRIAAAYVQTPEGQQAYAQSLARCMQRGMAGMEPGTAGEGEGDAPADAKE